MLCHKNRTILFARILAATFLLYFSIRLIISKIKSTRSKSQRSQNNRNDLKMAALKDGFTISVLHAGSSDLCMAVVCIGDEYRKDVAQYTQSKLEYARRHDYTLVTLDSSCQEVVDHSENRHPSWSKLPFVDWLLGHFHTVCMLDADIYVSNVNEPLYPLLNRTADVVIQRTSYAENHPILQSSAVVFRPRARATIRRASAKTLSNNERPRFPGLEYEDWGEQTFLQQELEANLDGLFIEHKSFSCLQQDDACDYQFPFWHMAGSNLPGSLDAHITNHIRKSSATKSHPEKQEK